MLETTPPMFQELYSLIRLLSKVYYISLTDVGVQAIGQPSLGLRFMCVIHGLERYRCIQFN